MTRLFRTRRTNARGQSLVELSLILPVLLLIVLGTLEFGFVFDHHLTLQYGTREGARVGSAMVNGGGPLGCPGGESTEEVDAKIVAAVQRVLTSPGSPVDIEEVSEIRIYQADEQGNEEGPVNLWTNTPDAGPEVDGVNVDFSLTTTGWEACERSNVLPAQSIGVSLSYTYTYQTPLTALMSWTTLTMSDRTIMQFNPTNTN